MKKLELKESHKMLLAAYQEGIKRAVAAVRVAEREYQNALVVVARELGISEQETWRLDEEGKHLEIVPPAPPQKEPVPRIPRRRKR